MTTKKAKHFAYDYNYFETQAWLKNKVICGIDEAGRGALAGPVVIAAVVLPINTTYHLLKDSKIMTEKQRNEAYDWITKNSYYSITLASHTIIDRINIYQATKIAMHEAFTTLINHNNLITKTDFIISDAMPLSLSNNFLNYGIKHTYFNYGESISTTIAAASIIAKVTRDRLMINLDKLFPRFKFAKHKGYGTAEHTSYLEQFGPSLVHRTTFIRNYKHSSDALPHEQKDIFI